MSSRRSPDQWERVARHDADGTTPRRRALSGRATTRRVARRRPVPPPPVARPTAPIGEALPRSLHPAVARARAIRLHAGLPASLTDREVLRRVAVALRRGGGSPRARDRTSVAPDPRA